MKRFLAVFAYSAFALSPVWAATSQEYLDAGTNLYKQGQYEQAAKYLQAAVQVDPKNWQAYQTLGTCRYQLKQLPEALAAFDQSLVLHPDNPGLKSFADSLRPQVAAPANPPPPPPAASAGSTDNSNAVSPAPGTSVLTDTQAEGLLKDFYAAKKQEENSREGLKLYGENHPLTEDEAYVSKWGSPKGDFHDNHFNLIFGILTPSVVNIDIGFFLEPTTNLGAAIFYLPLSSQVDTTYNSVTHTYSYYTVPGDLIYFEPRIKFYSSPGGLSSFHGFSFIYYGLHQGAYYSSFDIFGLGYLFGFRTLPMDGMTMELGFKLGAAVIFDTLPDYYYVSASNTYTSSQTVVPFPYIIPEFRFGFTF